jgi:hypothetical protein
MRRFTPALGRGARTASLCGLAVALSLPCLARSGAPTRLVDGSVPPSLPAALRAHGGALKMTRVRAGVVRSMRASLARCPQAPEAGGQYPVVERIGYHGRSVTFLVSRSVIAGCDRSPRARGVNGPWCGLAGWRFADHRVTDARLDLCYKSRGSPAAAFGWINPVRHAKWIVIDQPGYREVYPVAGGLPVRVSTVKGLGRRPTVFGTAQYDARGVLLVRRKVVAVIAS